MVSREVSAVAVLLADLARARQGLNEAFSCVDEELRGQGEVPADPKTLAYLAVSLSQYYNALEDLLERTARVFEGPPAGEAWHAELLRRAAVDLPGLRPAVIPTGGLADAFTLLKFRYFLRHACAVKLDARKLTAVIEALTHLHPRLGASLADLRRFLEATLEPPITS